MYFALFVALAPFSFCFAGNVTLGGACRPANTRLDPFTHKLITDCDAKTFCAPSNTCEAQKCRRDEYPFGYAIGDTLPPLCSGGLYCPDQGNGCQPLIQQGNVCEQGRDDECGPSPDGTLPSNATSVCLNSICMTANITLGQPCILEETAYVGVGPNQQQFTNTVYHDNCIELNSFCEPATKTCRQTKQVGAACMLDQECSSYNCGDDKTCIDPPEKPTQVAPWKYVLGSISVSIVIITICLLLTMVHRHQRLQHYAELQEYYIEQMSYRRTIMLLHATSTGAYSKSASLAPWLVEQLGPAQTM